VATDRGDDQPRGLARLIQVTEDLCLIDVTVQGLSPGKHAIAVHENGNISQGAASCGGHYNPHGVAHGEPDHGRGMEVPGHVGDLGNITVDENGWGDMLIETRRFAVWDVIGRSMVIAHGEDDLGRGTEPASKINGNAGQGALCGVIARSAGVFENTKRICACDGRTLWEEARLKSHNL
jgi:copper chaperone for superoxide dismutase